MTTLNAGATASLLAALMGLNTDQKPADRPTTPQRPETSARRPAPPRR